MGEVLFFCIQNWHKNDLHVKLKKVISKTSLNSEWEYLKIKKKVIRYLYMRHKFSVNSVSELEQITSFILRAKSGSFKNF